MTFYLNLFFRPDKAWDSLVQVRHGLSSILMLHLLPLVLLVTTVEGVSLMRWGKWQPRFHRFREFSLESVIGYEVVQAVLLLTMVLAAALLLHIIVRAFDDDRRHTYLNAFTMVAYGLTPLFAARLLDFEPMINPWVSWGVGILLMTWCLYQGVPRVLQPYPTQAFGFYLAAITVVVLVSGIIRIPTAMYLLGEVDLHHSWMTHRLPGMVRWLDQH